MLSRWFRTSCRGVPRREETQGSMSSSAVDCSSLAMEGCSEDVHEVPALRQRRQRRQRRRRRRRRELVCVAVVVVLVARTWCPRMRIERFTRKREHSSLQPHVGVGFFFHLKGWFYLELVRHSLSLPLYVIRCSLSRSSSTAYSRKFGNM